MLLPPHPGAPFSFALACVFLLAAGFTPRGAGAQVAVENSTPPPVSGRRLSMPETIVPADVLARVELLRGSVDLLRRYMGKPEASVPLLQVEHARPMEVYSQALNLELRASRLAFEQVRVVRSQSLPVTREARPSDVFVVVDKALASVLLVKRQLGIEVAIGEDAQPPSTTPTEVFNATIRASSELNDLLEARISPSDVFQLVTAAVHTAASLHAAVADGPNLPQEPAFEPNKMPSDVFTRMTHCYEIVRGLGARQGIEMLSFELGDSSHRLATPNDVSDLASLIVEELNSLLAFYPEARTPARAYYPGDRFPSHVYQRVGLLEAILNDLLAADS